MSGVIEAEGLRREFGDTVAVSDVTFTVEDGAVFALVGPNGAGKTTLLKMLAALLEPTAGTARVCGHDIQDAPREVHACLGFLTDFGGLYENLAVREYLRYFHMAYRLPAGTRSQRIDEVLSLVGLTTQADSAIDTLSRGMRQKLSLARTLLHDPRLLLLDEPASGLDPGARHDMQGLLRTLARRGKTIIVSSHILAELEDYCSHVAILDHGSLIFAGSLEEARRSLGKGRRVRLRALSGMDEAIGILGVRKGVEDVQRSGDEASFEFQGDDAAAAELLRALVERGVGVVAFAEAAGTIQDSYLSVMGRKP
jgi:ABC-2 type transport system ATP-binding protein